MKKGGSLSPFFVIEDPLQDLRYEEIIGLFTIDDCKSEGNKDDQVDECLVQDTQLYWSSRRILDGPRQQKEDDEAGRIDAIAGMIRTCLRASTTRGYSRFNPAPRNSIPAIPQATPGSTGSRGVSGSVSGGGRKVTPTEADSPSLKRIRSTGEATTWTV